MPPTNDTGSSSASGSEGRWKRWGKNAFDKSIVVSDWAAGYANGASAKMGGERFWPKSNDFPEEIGKCERILRAFTVEGIQASKTEETTESTTDAAGKASFMTRKRKVLRKIPPKVIQRAKGIVIYTAMRSGIAPFGGAGGAGLMMARMPDGSWSAPSSISPNNLSVGLLLGFDIFDVILVVNTEKAMKAFQSHKVTLGAETAVAAGPFGAGISGEIGMDRIPVYSYVRSRGLYGGVEAMAQAFLHRFDENERIYYWPGVTAKDIFEGKVRKPPIMDPLYRALRDAESGTAQGDSLERTVYETVHAPPNLAVRQLQGEASASILEDGERLKLPPTPEELDAFEQAGIPDDFDLALEKKVQAEAKIAAVKEREEIFALPPPPRHRTVDKYWDSRGANRDGKRRVAPPLHDVDASHLPIVEPDHEEFAQIDLHDEHKPKLPARNKDISASMDEPDLLPDYASDTASTAAKSANDMKEGYTAIGAVGTGVTLSSQLSALRADDSSIRSMSPVALDGNSSQGHSYTNTSGEPMSRSGSLSAPPSRPPRRAAAAAATKQTHLDVVSGPSAPKLIIFFDWDETISSHDTLSLIAPPPGTQLHGPDFSTYTDAYMKDMDAYTSAFGDRDTLDRQMEFLGGLDALEVDSLARVEQGGLFKGVRLTEMLSRASQVKLREGWANAFSWLHNETRAGTLVSHVISVGWSGEFIRRAIEEAAGQADVTAPASIFANEIEMDSNGIGTGKLTKSNAAATHNSSDPSHNSIRTGLHKVAILEHLLSQHKVSEDGRNENETVSVYVGDSNTDLPCLLRVNYGLVMGGNESLLATIHRIGLTGSLVSASSFSPQTSRPENNGAVLITVSDWHEGLEVLRKIHEACA